MTAPDLPTLTPRRLGQIRSRLLAWYDARVPDFPWRTARDPYAALVAAVCAQQTQMPRVLETYARWMAAFPTLADCAGASREDVLRTWGRAGYPRRAAYLHETARRCMAEHGGALPRDREALLALPGVGPFTAAIVRCFGFGDDAVAVDTNVVRVIGRIVFGDLQPARETSPAAIDAAAGRLLRPGTAVRWNPALMDYGASVCGPRPRCDECVVAALCAARPRFAAGERAARVRVQPGFAGSDRERRGRILAVLRAHHGAGMSTRALWRALASPPADRARMRALLDTLVADGLAWRRGQRCGLGEGPPGAAVSDGDVC